MTLAFTSTIAIDTPQVILKVGDTNLNGTPTLSSTNSINWEVRYTVLGSDPNGVLSFNISSPILYTSFTETTNLSRVTIDTSSASIPIPNVQSGTYTLPKEIVLTSSASSVIRYTLDGSTPTCSRGNIYLSPFMISSSKILKAISCDLASNRSPILELSITIFPDSEILDNTQEEEEQIEIVKDDFIPILKYRILEKNLNPIPNLPVTINSKPQTQDTDSNGIVTFINIPIGSHTISYSYNEKEYSQDISIDLEESKSAQGIVDIITYEEVNNTRYFIYAGIFVFALLLFIIIRGIVKDKKNIDKEVY